MSATDAVRTPLAAEAPRGSGAIGRRGNRRHSTLDALAVGLPALLAVGLGLYELTTRSLWLDEAATVAIASQHGSAFGSALAHDGGNMLGYYALVHLLIGWFGAGPLVIRLPSVIFAGGAAGATAALGLRLFGRRVATLAGMLTAVSLTLVYWGQDARGYGAMIALVAASFLALVALLEPTAGWRAWAAYVIFTTAAVYTGLEAALIIPAQLVALSWQRERWRVVLGALATVAAACVPLVVLAAGRGSGQLFWVPPPSFRILRQVADSLTSSGLQPNFYSSTGTALLVLTLVVLLAGAGKLAWARRHTREQAATGGAMLTVSWLLVPGLLAALESVFGQSVLQPRYLLVSLPAVSLLLAWTLLDRRLPRPLIAAVIVALIVLRALQLAPAYGVSSEDWRGATSHVIRNTQPRDCIAFYPLDTRQPFEYYLASSTTAPRPILPTLAWDRVRPFVEDYASLSPLAVSRLPGRCGRVWLVASHEGRGGGPPTSRANYRRFVDLTAGLRRIYPRQQTSSFGARGVATVTLYSR